MNIDFVRRHRLLVDANKSDFADKVCFLPANAVADMHWDFRQIFWNVVAFVGAQRLAVAVEDAFLLVADHHIMMELAVFKRRIDACRHLLVFGIDKIGVDVLFGIEAWIAKAAAH